LKKNTKEELQKAQHKKDYGSTKGVTSDLNTVAQLSEITNSQEHVTSEEGKDKLDMKLKNIPESVSLQKRKEQELSKMMTVETQDTTLQALRMKYARDPNTSFPDLSEVQVSTSNTL